MTGEPRLLCHSEIPGLWHLQVFFWALTELLWGHRPPPPQVWTDDDVTVTMTSSGPASCPERRLCEHITGCYHGWRPPLAGGGGGDSGH